MPIFFFLFSECIHKITTVQLQGARCCCCVGWPYPQSHWGAEGTLSCLPHFGRSEQGSLGMCSARKRQILVHQAQWSPLLLLSVEKKSGRVDCPNKEHVWYWNVAARETVEPPSLVVFKTQCCQHWPGPCCQQSTYRQGWEQINSEVSFSKSLNTPVSWKKYSNSHHWQQSSGCLILTVTFDDLCATRWRTFCFSPLLMMKKLKSIWLTGKCLLSSPPVPTAVSGAPLCSPPTPWLACMGVMQDALQCPASPCFPLCLFSCEYIWKCTGGGWVVLAQQKEDCGRSTVFSRTIIWLIPFFFPLNRNNPLWLWDGLNHIGQKNSILA